MMMMLLFVYIRINSSDLTEFNCCWKGIKVLCRNFYQSIKTFPLKEFVFLEENILRRKIIHGFYLFAVFRMNHRCPKSFRNEILFITI